MINHADDDELAIAGERPAISAGLAHLLVILVPLAIAAWVVFAIGVWTVISWLA